MRKAVQLVFIIVFSATLAACGGGGSQSTPSVPPVTTQAQSQAYTTSSIVWKAGDPVLGKWTRSNTNQCGTPVLSAATFAFTLNRSGTTCSRNQVNPLNSSDSLSRLVDGATYTWAFDYYDGKSNDTGPGMGLDRDARSLIWQIHGYMESDSPCTGLVFVNGPQNVGGPQMWGLYTCAGLVWTGTYHAGERDTFKIVARLSETSSGYTRLYRNGVLVASVTGANYHNSYGEPWWNFGPYKWRWQLAGGGGSNMYQVNATITGMTLTKS